MSLKRILAETLCEDVKYVPSSFDIIGSRERAIAVVEFSPEAPETVKRIVGETLMKLHRNVKLVLAKTSGREGAFRLREYEVIAGEGGTEVIHVEHGVKLKLDITKVYFSPREATERLRISKQVKPGELVMVMFAGVGPYALMIARKQPLVEKVVAIELNPEAFRYMQENVRLNKLEDKVIPVLGDVRLKASCWYKCCDRVVMPLPKGAYEYLDCAFQCLKPEGGMVHFYYWAPENDLFTEAYFLLEHEAALRGMRVIIHGARKVSEYAPRVYKVCIDANVLPIDP
ncbi:MAG: class I SAM-dependent methyltransferase family protein [Thermofilaceae archaeon]